MKKVLFVSLILLASLTFNSCSTIADPDTWAVEIEDAFRVQVISVNAYLVYGTPAMDAFADKWEAKAEEIEDERSISNPDVAKYKLALEQMAKNDALAADLLDAYNKVDVKFSKWEKQPGKKDGYLTWTAVEENTGIKVTFKNNSLLEWDLNLDEDSFNNYIEKTINSIFDGIADEYNSAQNTNNDKWLLSYWKNVMGNDYNSDIEQYIKKKYPSGITTEKIVFHVEYEDDEDEEELVPTENVIADVVSNCYCKYRFYSPAPTFVGEYYAKIYKKDVYKHLSLYTVCHVYDLCMDLINRGEFDSLMQTIEENKYPAVDISTLKSVKTEQDKNICKVLNAWADIEMGNAGLSGIEELFDNYFDFID